MDSKEEIMKQLTEPFELQQIQWKPQVVNEGVAMMVPYLDARDVAERLDSIFGPDGWQLDHKDVGGQTLSGLGARLNDEWVWKWDIGFVSGRGDDNIKLKGSLSDGLKRAAVLWGIGRYLYRVPPSWCNAETYEKNGNLYIRRLLKQPTMPSWAMPGESGSPPASSAKVLTGPAPSTSSSSSDGPNGKNKVKSTQKATNGDENWYARFWSKASEYDLDRAQGDEFVKKAEGDLEAAYNLLIAKMERPTDGGMPAAATERLGFDDL